MEAAAAFVLAPPISCKIRKILDATFPHEDLKCKNLKSKRVRDICGDIMEGMDDIPLGRQSQL